MGDDIFELFEGLQLEGAKDDNIPTGEVEDKVVEKEENNDAEPQDDGDDFPIGEVEEEAVIDTKSIYEALLSEDLLEVDDDFKFDGSVESLKQAQKATLDKQRNLAMKSLLEDLDPKIKDIVKYNLNGGTDFKQFLEEVPLIEAIEQETFLSEKGNQVLVIKELYKKTTTFSEEKIDRLIAQADKEGLLLEEAESAKEELKTLFEQQRTQKASAQEAAKKEQEQIALETMRRINSKLDSAEYIKEADKSKLKAYMFNTTRKKGEESAATEFSRTLKQITEKEEHLIQLAYILKDYSTEKGIDLTKIEKVGEKKSYKELRDKIDNVTSAKVKQQGGASESKPKFNWKEYLGE